MKQNEKFLVYAVTGFLVVILAVAILFGGETPRRVPDEVRLPVVASAPPSLEEVLNRRAGVTPPSPVEPSAAEKGAEGGAGPAATPDVVDPAANGSAAAPATNDKPLAANVQLLPPSAAAQVTEKLGLNRREHDYRLVRARAGDSLGTLVQKWCGTTGDFLEQARALNEELTTLRVGQEVVLPWVDDEVLLAAIESRGVAAAPPTSAPVSPASPVLAAMGLDRPAATPAVAKPNAAGAANAANAAATRRYRIKAGDSLWKIAEREVGRKQAKQYLEQISSLNSGLDADRIREGQEIVLPPKN